MGNLFGGSNSNLRKAGQNSSFGEADKKRSAFGRKHLTVGGGAPQDIPLMESADSGSSDGKRHSFHFDSLEKGDAGAGDGVRD